MKLYSDGLIMKTSYSNLGSFYSVCILGSYDLLLSTVTKDDVVVDGGSNIGAFTLLASRKAKKVIAVEPNETNFNLLKENIFLNRCDNVLAINAALYNKDGTIRFSGKAESGHISTFGNRVKAITLDKLSSDDITILKLDIEGSEPLVLLNERSLAKYKAIAFEWDMNQYRNLLTSGIKMPDIVPMRLWLPSWKQMVSIFNLINMNARELEGRPMWIPLWPSSRVAFS